MDKRGCVLLRCRRQSIPNECDLAGLADKGRRAQQAMEDALLPHSACDDML